MEHKDNRNQEARVAQYQKPTQADKKALERASALLRMEDPTPVNRAMSVLFRRAFWMGNLSLDMLSRVPFSEVIDLAWAVLGEERPPEDTPRLPALLQHASDCTMVTTTDLTCSCGAVGEAVRRRKRHGGYE